jgi:hypothetical protein
MTIPLHTGSRTLADDSSPDRVKAAVRLVVIAGLVNSLIAAFLLCRLPASHATAVMPLFLRAGIYVAFGALAGVTGAWFYWKRSAARIQLRPLVSFRLFALVSAAVWVWVPAAVLLARQDSLVAGVVAAIGGIVLAIGLRKSVQFPDDPQDEGALDAEKELFAQTLATPVRQAHGYIIAVGLYAAGYALEDRSTLTACALLGFSAFVFGWQSTLAPGARSGYWDERQAALRLARIAVPAVLITLWALVHGIERRDSGDGDAAMAGGDDAGSKQDARAAGSGNGLNGYESIVLWPFPEKKQIVPPLPEASNLLGPGTTEPLVIRFDGPYFYFQAGRRPDLDSHQAQGSPLAVHIASSNALPLTIEAHQTLSQPIGLARCRELEVDVANRDNRPGAITLAVLVADSTAPGKPTLYLGQQPLATTEPRAFLVKNSPVYESLRFAIPPQAKLRKFDEITVLLLPDIEHALVGPKIAIQQFQLYPR